MNPLTLLALLTEPEFVRGVGVGVGALLLTVASRGRVGWFLAWGTAAVAGLLWTAWRASYGAPVTWVMLPATVWVLAAGSGVHQLARATPRPAVPALFALTVLGVWGTVPDTEGARVLMGVTAGMAPAIWPLRVTRVGMLGPFLAVGTVAVVTVLDGAARPGSIVGALGAAGMLLVAPAVLSLRKTFTIPVSGWLLVTMQVAFVIVSGRLAGRMTPAAPALALWIAAAITFALAWWGLERRLHRAA